MYMFTIFNNFTADLHKPEKKLQNFVNIAARLRWRLLFLVYYSLSGLFKAKADLEPVHAFINIYHSLQKPSMPIYSLQNGITLSKQYTHWAWLYFEAWQCHHQLSSGQEKPCSCINNWTEISSKVFVNLYGNELKSKSLKWILVHF